MKGLTKARKAAGMTMAELARRAEITVTSVFRYEHGDRRPKADILLRMSKALNVSMEELMED